MPTAKVKTIREIIGLNPTPGDIGVEIEVEGTNLPTALDPVYWRVDKDNSLRGESYEYVMHSPKSLKEVGKALDSLLVSYTKYGSKVTESIRTGVHVHRNVQSLTMTQLMTFITSYFILEDVLVHWCGEQREGNHFCLRAKDAEYVIFLLEKVARMKKLIYLKTDNIRYCSLNLLSLFKYGSLEFRAMRGTHDLGLIMTWAEMIEDLYNSSLRFPNPRELILSMSGDGEQMFLENMLPNTYHLLKNSMNSMWIREGARRIQTLAFTTDWDSFEKPSKNVFANNNIDIEIEENDD